MVASPRIKRSPTANHSSHAQFTHLFESSSLRIPTTMTEEESTSTHHSIAHHHHHHPIRHSLPSASQLHPCGTATTKASTGSFLDRFFRVFSPEKRPSPSLEKLQNGLLHVPNPPPLVLPGGDVASGPRGGEEEYYFGRVFRYIDEDGDGKISPSELRSCMRTVGEELSEEDAEAVVESTDSDGDGLLGFDDFVKLVEVEGEQERTRDLREAFGMYATEGVDGCITPKSLRRMLARLGEWKSLEECRIMIQRFDINGDGVLSFDEFRVMML